MSKPDYLFEFRDIRDGYGFARFVNYRRGQEADINVELDDCKLVFLSHHKLTPCMADMLDLGLAVYVADRLSTARNSVRRAIHISLPVRHPEVLNHPQVLETLQDILYTYTGDYWSFEFTHRHRYGRLAERQPTLIGPSYSNSKGAIEVALWSGGLDALAGLYCRMNDQDSADHFTLFGTGGNSRIHAIQSNVACAMALQHPQSFERSSTLVQVPIRLSYTSHLPKNSSPRARGFVFLLLGAVCALMEDQARLYVYENGIGAINLPYRPSEVGLDHSRAVHPGQLVSMGRLVSLLSDSNFSFHNPFEFMTKAELCAPLVRGGVTDLIDLTVSCDRRHRAVPMQCGCCSSCLLRRQALAVNRVSENPGSYRVTSNPALAKRLQNAGGGHLQAMLSQVADMLEDLDSVTPWLALTARYIDLADLAEDVAHRDNIPLGEVQRRLGRLYRLYAKEWQQVHSIIEQGSLPHLELDTLC